MSAHEPTYRIALWRKFVREVHDGDWGDVIMYTALHDHGECAIEYIEELLTGRTLDSSAWPHGDEA